MADITHLNDAVAEADYHHHNGDVFCRIAKFSHRPEYWLNRASIAYALAQTIIISMKEDGHA